MSAPNPSLSVPTLKEFQLSYGGLTFGGVESGLPYQLEGSPEGLYDTAEITTGDQKRPLDQGEFPGIDTYGGRSILLTLVVQTDGVSFEHARQALSGVMKVKGSVEEPLWFRLPSGLYAVQARPRKFSCPLGVESVFGKFAVANAMLHCTDPRVYSAPTEALETVIPGEVGGLKFNATFPVTFGATVGGFIEVHNYGTEEVRPILEIIGPCKHPHVSNSSIAGNPTLEWALELVEGEKLVIDTDWQTATLITRGATEGSSVRKKLVHGSTWFGLNVGANGIQFGSLDTSATGGKLIVQAASGFAGG